MRSIKLLSTAAILAGVRSSHGQEIPWMNPQGGSWNVEANWQNGEIPDSWAETARIDAPGAYTVDFDRSTLLGGLRVLNPLAEVSVHAGDSLYMPTLPDYLSTTSGAALTVNGVLTINAERENRLTEISVCGDEYYYDYALAANGTGTIRLNAHPDNLDSARIGNFCVTGLMRVGPTQTIAGTGRIHVDMANSGTIVADVPGGVLELRASWYRGLGNSGELRAENGGILRVLGGLNGYSSGLNGGEVVVADAQSAVEWVGSAVYESTIDNSAGGVSTFQGECALQDVRLLGPQRLPGGSEVWTNRGFTNDGTLILRSDDAGPAILSIGSDLTIDGTGTIVLNSPADLPTLARIDADYYSGGDLELRFGTLQRLVGTGQVGVDVVNLGTVSPGVGDDPIGLIELRSTNWTQLDGAQMVIDIRGTAPGDFDRITRIDHVILRGTLVVRVTDGFVPRVGDEFVILTHQSQTSTFEFVEAPDIPGLRVRYEENATVLTIVCATDIDGDGQVGLTDLALLLTHFGTSGPGVPGDVNADNSVTLQDLSLLLRAFGGPCS